MISYRLSVQISFADKRNKDELVSAFDSLVNLEPDVQIIVEDFNNTLFLGAMIEVDPNDPEDLYKILDIIAAYLWEANGKSCELDFTATPLEQAHAVCVLYDGAAYATWAEDQKKKKGSKDVGVDTSLAGRGTVSGPLGGEELEPS